MKDEEKISKWLNKELSPQELAEFRKTEDYQHYGKIVERAASFKAPDYDSQHGLEELRKKLANRTAPKVRRLQPSTWYKVAAVAVVFLASALFLLINKPSSLNTGQAEIASIELPDQSKVTLNSDSRIKYRSSKWERQRQLTLEGEAFFEVETGNQFTVKTDQGTVRVLGTEFNVKTRPGIFEVTCYEGSVKVSYKEEEFVLSAGSSLRAEKGQEPKISQVKATAPGWMQQESDFQGVALREVLRELENVFNIEINAENLNLDQEFTGSFSHKDLELALKSVCLPLQLEYRIEPGNKVVLYEQEP